MPFVDFKIAVAPESVKLPIKVVTEDRVRWLPLLSHFLLLELSFKRGLTAVGPVLVLFHRSSKSVEVGGLNRTHTQDALVGFALVDLNFDEVLTLFLNLVFVRILIGTNDIKLTSILKVLFHGSCEVLCQFFLSIRHGFFKSFNLWLTQKLVPPFLLENGNHLLKLHPLTLIFVFLLVFVLVLEENHP